MELWELVARESIRDRIARWNSNGDAGRMAEMVKVLAPDVEFSIRDGEVMHGRDEVLQSLLGVQRRQGAFRRRHRAATGRYLPARQAAVDPPLHQQPQIDFESDTRARVRTYYAGAVVVRTRPLGSLPRRVRRRRRRVAHHQAHGHHRGRRPRRLGRGPGVSEPGTAAADHEHDARRPVRGDRARANPMPSRTSTASNASRTGSGWPAPTRSPPSCGRAGWRRATSSRSGCRRASTTRSRTRRARVSARSPPASTRASVPARSPRSSSAASRWRCCTRATRSRSPAAHPPPR